jgi:hypothetical protein
MRSTYKLQQKLDINVFRLKIAYLHTYSYLVTVFFISSMGISDTVPHRLLLQAGSNTTMITRHHHHHFPTLSLEHLSLSLKLPT